MLITNMILNSVPNITTGHIIFDTIATVIVALLILNLKRCDRWIFKHFVNIMRHRQSNRIVFSTQDNKSSKRLKAVIHHISKLNNSTIKVLQEMTEWNYNRNTDDYEESKVALYRIDQEQKFTIDTNIEGIIYYTNKEKSEYNGRISYTDITCLEIFSKKLSLIELQEWVEKKLDEYNKYIKSKTCDKQLLVEVGWDPKEGALDISHHNWKSNVTFENRFFTDKDKILQKINFFINNPEWYQERGIPYTLGFLLWGEPGCGKTGFIKALMNLTKRHGISVKLNNNFNMNKLREIIFEDELSDSLIIPQENRILIFEDIDCMGDIVKDRDIKESEKSLTEERVIKSRSSEDSDTDDIFIKPSKKDGHFNNNLSYFLNILDGLQECPGRIIIMTTNKPETLDKALVRPGRIDYKLNFTMATLDDIEKIINHYWSSNSTFKINPALDKTVTPAEVVNICRSSETYEETIDNLNVLIQKN